jgi:NAD(P)-dependent dehydrogenase (short-subunit alcohol dehydrogenase family)
VEHLDKTSIKSILLLGATGGIGGALLRKLAMEFPDARIDCVIRKEARSFPPGVRCYLVEEINEENLSEVLLDAPDYQLIINTIGYLDNELGGPEKSVRDLDEEKLMSYFQVNALITPILAKILRTRLSSPFAFITLSAMVGSIGENELGGWYGYRVSKAALNMFIKNLAVEFGRTHKQSLFLSIHPGTTQTRLSEKYNSRVTHKIHTPDEAAENILRIIFGTPFQKTGSFINWDGRTISW